MYYMVFGGSLLNSHSPFSWLEKSASGWLFPLTLLGLGEVLAQNPFTTLCFWLFSSRMIDVQIKMAERAVELLCVPEDKPCYVLDIGWDPGAQFRQSRWGDVPVPHTVESVWLSSSCGTGLSGDYLSDEGHYWVGIDISPAMLGKYALFSTGVDGLPWVWSGDADCLDSSPTLSQYRWGFGPRHTGRCDSGGHGSGHTLQTGHLWCLYQVRVSISCF